MLLRIDAAVNLTPGLLLVFFPRRLATMWMIPIPDTTFYPSLLGAVLCGIGLAPVLEGFRHRTGVSGLGLAGALCINACGAGVLVAWLFSGKLAMAWPGYVFLWTVAFVVLGLAGIEAAQLWRHRDCRHGDTSCGNALDSNHTV
jgi:hypothetical protein